MLALVVSCATPILMLATLQEMNGHLIVVVTYLGILAIDCLPSIVLRTTIHTCYFHTMGPNVAVIHWYSHSRLHQVVVDIHT